MVNTGVNWTIGDGLKKIAWRMPEKTALIFEDKFITYRELNEGANRVAHFLKEKGIKKATYDRNGHLYHGRVQAMADGLRKGGIQI